MTQDAEGEALAIKLWQSSSGNQALAIKLWQSSVKRQTCPLD
jgi:hypothetical protein